MELNDLIYLAAMMFYAKRCNEYKDQKEAMDVSIERAHILWSMCVKKG